MSKMHDGQPLTSVHAMSAIRKLTAEEYDSMIEKGAFNGLKRRIELIRGELREMNPAGPVHEDYVDYLNRWSTNSTEASECVVRVQSSIDLGDSRPEPDIAWLSPGRYSTRRPQPADVLLIIEVADSSLTADLNEKATLYAQFNIAEYWVVDATGRRDTCIETVTEIDIETSRNSPANSPYHRHASHRQCWCCQTFSRSEARIPRGPMTWGRIRSVRPIVRTRESKDFNCREWPRMGTDR